jgi:hypothetical protein
LNSQFLKREIAKAATIAVNFDGHREVIFNAEPTHSLTINCETESEFWDVLHAVADVRGGVIVPEFVRSL